MVDFPLFPEQASSVALRVDTLLFALLALGVFFSTLIAFLVLFLSVRYRKGSKVKRNPSMTSDIRLEIAWTLIPTGISLILFVWGATLYFEMSKAPSDAMEVYVVGKQWMWKIQHPVGRREINTLHVPIGRPVKLIMTSQDVIHSFFVPAFRVKMDVLPGRFTTLWFEATKLGSYHLFCAEYCGTKHSGMIGKVEVMTEADYQEWLSGGSSNESLSSSGKKLFQKLGCKSCHAVGRSQRGPTLDGLFGKPVQLKTGGTIIADENYLRESILNPKAKVVAGFEPLMSTYEGQVNENDLLKLIEYIKSTGESEGEH